MSFKVSHHLLLCATSQNASCCEFSVGAASWAKLKEVVRKFDLENPQRSQGVVLRSKVDCLRVCKEGPVLLIWPDGIWYGKVTSEKIESIIVQHVIRGVPLEDWIIRKTPQV